MAGIKSRSKTKLDSDKSGRCLSIYRSISRTLVGVCHRHNSHHSKYKRHRYHNYILAISLLGNPVLANTSNTAAPSASASGSVSNFATQVLGGPMVENMYGNNIKCSGPQLAFSPFISSSFNQKRPQDYIYHTPVYDPTDLDEDGVPDNPGEVLYYQENYSNNKDSLGLNLGFALTFNIPLDNRFQDSCLDAAQTQIKLQKQELNAKLLNYEIARLKNCGDLMLKGIYFDPKSNFAKLCEGVVVSPPPNQVIPHTHKFK